MVKLNVFYKAFSNYDDIEPHLNAELQDLINSSDTGKSVEFRIEIENLHFHVFVAKRTNESIYVAITCLEEEQGVAYLDFKAGLYFEEYGLTASGGGNFFQRNLDYILNLESIDIPTDSFFVNTRKFSYEEGDMNNSLHINSNNRGRGIGTKILYLGLNICRLLDIHDFRIIDSTQSIGDPNSSYYNRFIKVTFTHFALAATDKAQESLSEAGFEFIKD